MKLIADAGSTKIEWILTENGQEIKRRTTAGYNPYYYEKELLRCAIKEELMDSVGLVEVQEIYYYGSGCSTEENNEKVRSVIAEFFPKAAIEVGHDLLGAARGLCGREAGIACIMGTGSNSCYYDGVEVVDNVESVGWLFGDKASGAHIGKSFIGTFLTKECPKELRELFTETTALDFDKTLSKIYSEGNPHRFFAQASYFVGNHIEHPFMEGLVRTSFREFFLENVCKYEKHREVPVNCTGSIALVFEDLMRSEAEKLGLTIGGIIKAPTDGLVKFHG